LNSGPAGGREEACDEEEGGGGGEAVSAADGGVFRRRAEKGDVEKAKAILRKAGRSNPPMAGDELEVAERI